MSRKAMRGRGLEILGATRGNRFQTILILEALTNELRVKMVAHGRR